MKLISIATAAAAYAALSTPLLAFADSPPAKPDADMKVVLDTLGGLGGKPIETLTPDEARKQPTPSTRSRT